MKAVLINPTNLKLSMIPVGILYIAAVMERKGIEVKVIYGADRYRIYSDENIISEVEGYKPDLVGVTILTGMAERAYRIAARLKNLKIPLICGGHHASACSEETIEHGFDIAVCGEGEQTISELCDCFIIGADIRNVKGIVFRNQEGNIIKTESRPLIDNIDSLPIPAWHLVNLSDFDKSRAIVLGSRGCQYRCSFCDNIMKRLRFHSIERVLHEITELKTKYGVRNIGLADCSLAFDKSRTMEFLDRLIEKKLDISFTCQARVKQVDIEFLEKLNAAGLKCIAIGADSFIEKGLKYFDKRQSVKDILDAVDVVRKSSVNECQLNLITAVPVETANDIDETYKLGSNLMRKTGNLFIYIDVLVPYPGTYIYKTSHEKYGFTNWWLEDSSDMSNIPYYRKNKFGYSIYQESKNYFNIEFKLFRKSEKIIRKFQFKKAVKDCGYFKVFLSMMLNRFSRLLYMLDPGLEKKVFQLLRK